MINKTLFRKLALAGCTLLAATGITRAQLAASLADIGSAAPTPGPNDQSQLLSRVGSANFGGLNYYWDAGNPPGQTFFTGSNPGGYIMNAVSIKTGGGGGANGAGAFTTTQAFNLRVYAISGATSNSAALVAFYSSQPFSFTTETDWLQMSGLGLPLKPNTLYAYTFGRSTAGYENLASTNGDAYPRGLACQIPPNGGNVVYTTALDADGTFDIGMSLPTALTVAPPISSVPNPIVQGATVILTAGTVVDNAGNGTYTYQWQTDNGSGGATFANISGATSASYTNITATAALGNTQYRVLVTDSASTSVTSSPISLAIIQQMLGTLIDTTNTPPLPGSADQAQLTQASGFIAATGLNYYTDNGANNGLWAGQTFTTGNNPKGYSFTSLSIGLSGGSFNPAAPTQTNVTYDLYIYRVSADGTTATLLADVTNVNWKFNYPTWAQWTFPQPIILTNNTTYGYGFGRRAGSPGGIYAGLSTSPASSDAYTGGQIAVFPTTGGTITYGAAAEDAAFDAGLVPNGLAIQFSLPIANPNPAYALSPVKVSCTPITAGIFTFQWLTDDGLGGYKIVPGATTTNLLVTPPDLNPAGADYTTNFYLMASTGGNTATSTPVTLTVHPALAPQFTITPTPTNLVTYVGGTVTYSVTEIGSLPITNQWQFNNGSGFVSLTSKTNSTLTLNNLQTTNSGTYQIVATNAMGSTSSPVTLTVLAAPAAPTVGQKYYNSVFTNNAWAYWRLNETGDPTAIGAPTYQAYDSSGHAFNGTYGNAVTLNNVGPRPPSFPGFDSTETAAGTSIGVAASVVTVPPLRIGGNSNITFIAWINPSGSQIASAGLFFNRNGSDAAGFGFGGTPDHLGYTWNNNSSATWSWDSGLTVADNEWNFVAYVITPTNATLYLGNLGGGGSTNFVQASNPINHIGEAFSGGTTWLGGDPSSTSRIFTGLIAEAALFTNAMTTAQVQQYFLTSIGAVALRPTLPAATVVPASPNVYSGQNVRMTVNASGTEPLTYQWQSSLDANTWADVPGANGNTLIVNPLTVGTIYYQLIVTNIAGGVTNFVTAATFSPLPSYPPGLWTVNFQETNNLGANQTIGGGVGHYVGRGVLGTGMTWNALPHILPLGSEFSAGTITNVTDFRDDGVTHSGITCQMNNGGSYNSLGATLQYPSDLGNLTEQYYRTYFSPNSLQFGNVPSGNYNLVCYAGNGKSSEGAANFGSTFAVHAANGDQTNSTACPTPVGALTEGVNFITFTNVHIVGSLNVDVMANDALGSSAVIEGAQLQLVSFDVPVASFTGAPTNGFLGQTVIFANTSTGTVTNAVWTFGDGTSVTNSSTASVSHSYTLAGSYTVGLTVAGPGGSSSTNRVNYIVVISNPTIGGARMSGGNFVLSGSNGTPGSPYRILSSTNISLPLSNWTVGATGTFGIDGSYSYTNASPTNPANFYRLVSP